MNEIHQEIEALWKQAASLTALDPPYDPKFGETLDVYSKKAKDIAVSHLQPWLAILEQAISWLMALHLALTNDAKPKSEELRVAWVLTGAACSQAVAIRKLCLYGLDVPAKAVLRTLIETLNACIVTTYNEELRQLFRGAEDFDQAKKVWRKHFTQAKVQKQLEAILGEYELEAEVHENIKLWQEEEITLTNQAVHTSYLAALFATFPYPADRSTLQPGILGSATLFSVRTLSSACKGIWYYSMVGFSLLIRMDPRHEKPLYHPSKDEPGDQILFNGHYVLDHLVRKYWHEGFISDNENG